MTFCAVLAAVTVADSTRGLAATLESLQRQTHSRWQWSVVAAGGAGVYREVFRWAASDPRVVVTDGTGMAANELPAAALSVAQARFACRLDPGDTLDPGLVARLATVPEGRWVYTDEGADYDDDRGMEVWFKPEFCPELMRSQPYAVRSAMLPLAAIRELGGLRPPMGTAQWYDLALRVWERLGDPEHFPGPYYLRAARSTIPSTPWIDGSADDRCKAVGQHCDRVGITITELCGVEVNGHPIGQHIVRRLTASPRVSVVIPTRGSSSVIYGFSRCHVVELVRSLWTPERYPNLEVVVVYDADTPESVLAELTQITDGDVVLVPFGEPFHFSRKCNAGALVASGELLCFLNDDMYVRTPGWLHEMVALIQDPTVGAVGAKLLFADGTLQHAGHRYDGGTAGHLLLGHAANTIEHGGLAQLTGERAGVTGACMLVRCSDFAALGGFSDLFPLNFNDVDLCLKMREAGLRVLYTPFAELDHYESQTRVSRIERTEIVTIGRRWWAAMHSDPIVNPLQRAKYAPPSSLSIG